MGQDNGAMALQGWGGHFPSSRRARGSVPIPNDLAGPLTAPWWPWPWPWPWC